MLPVTVMSAESVLVLHGDTYTSRLWCVLELYCVFAFAPDSESAAKRVVFSIGSNAISSGIVRKLRQFDAADARCFDPNEENKIRRMIAATGKDAFDTAIHQLALHLQSHTQRFKVGVRAVQAVRRFEVGVRAVQPVHRTGTEKAKES
jgi:hypothetical protein